MTDGVGGGVQRTVSEVAAAAGVRLNELARRMGVSVRTVVALDTLGFPMPGDRRAKASLEAVADALGLTKRDARAALGWLVEKGYTRRRESSERAHRATLARVERRRVEVEQRAAERGDPLDNVIAELADASPWRRVHLARGVVLMRELRGRRRADYSAFNAAVRCSSARVRRVLEWGLGSRDERARAQHSPWVELALAVEGEPASRAGVKLVVETAEVALGFAAGELDRRAAKVLADALR